MEATFSAPSAYPELVKLVQVQHKDRKLIKKIESVLEMKDLFLRKT